MAYSCPDCAATLSVSSTGGARTLVCPSCHGRLFGLSPFERMLDEGVGVRVWTGAESGTPAGACPYCSRPMRRADADPDAPHDLAVCRLCQEVWVPDSATAWLSGHAPAAPGSGAATVTAVAPGECTNCGAPYEPDEEGRCRWCHAQIAARQPVVVFVQPEPEPASNWGLRLI